MYPGKLDLNPPTRGRKELKTRFDSSSRCIVRLVVKIAIGTHIKILWEF